MADADAAAERVWRRNLAALTAAVFIGFTGFTLVMPFLPIYIGEMGVTDVGDIAAWTGVTLGVTPAMTAVFAPLWGRLADRFGRRLMVARSLFSFIIIMAAMAFATKPWHLFALRVLQGFFAGYGALCLAMAAESAPPGKLAQSIGLVQTAQRLGPALGPVIGAVVAGLVGLRTTFLVTAVFYAVAFVLVLWMYTETPRAPRPAAGATGGAVTFRSAMAFENFLLLMVVIFGFQFVDRSFGPILPLFIAGMEPASRAAVVSGVIFSVVACSAAVGHHYCARLLRRWSSREVISRASLLAAAAALAMAFAPNSIALAAAAAAFGLAIGAAMTAAYTAAAAALPETVRATGFGFLTSASLVGIAVSPMVAGLLARIGLRAVFLANVAMLLVLGAIVLRTMGEAVKETTGPVVEDA
jgi:DHA1 family multidrug resistance protein-like MFS transporter